MTAVFIVCRDRLTPLVQLVEWLERHGHQRIVLVDNASTYPPLVEFLRRSPHEVVNLDENLGPVASVWGTGVLDRYAKNEHFVVTDCDVVPDEQCPGAAIDYFRWALRRFPGYVKAGFGLRIDDLPPEYALAADVQRWEQQFWLRPFAGNLYRSKLDTTFALYPPGMEFALGPAIRTGAPYLARHSPWYTDSANPTEEERYFRDHCRRDLSHWDLAGHAQPPATESLSLVERLRWRVHAALKMPRDSSVPRRYQADWEQ